MDAFNVNELEYCTMPFSQPCGESSFGLANHLGCRKKTRMALVLTNHPMMNEVIATDPNVYIFCCKSCLRKIQVASIIERSNYAKQEKIPADLTDVCIEYAIRAAESFEIEIYGAVQVSWDNRDFRDIIGWLRVVKVIGDIERSNLCSGQ